MKTSLPGLPNIADAVTSAFNSILDSIMKAIWSASVWLLRTALELVDGLLAFNTNLAGADGKPAAGSPFSAVWPTLSAYDLTCSAAYGLTCRGPGVS